MNNENYDIIGNFGIVKIIGEKYKGRFAYYDDDDCDYITFDYTINDLRKRNDEIVNTIKRYNKNIE